MNHLNKYFAEFLGAFVLTMCVALSLVSNLPIPTLMLAGLVLMFFVYTIGGISGSHINPAVTLGLWSIKKIGTKDAGIYVLVQCLGGFAAGCIVYILLGAVWTDLVSSLEYSFNVRVFAAEVAGMVVFTFGIASVVYGKVHESLSGVVVGLSLVLGISVAVMVGSIGGLNPAVIFGMWQLSLPYFIGPIVGSMLGFNLYEFLIK